MARIPARVPQDGLDEMKKVPELSAGLGALLPCPFCGDAAVFVEERGGGTMASGMEPYTIYAGCARCKIRFSGGDEQGWDMERRWYDRKKEAYKDAAALWNRRA